MSKRKIKSVSHIPDTQENINAYSETTTSDFQRAADLDVSSQTAPLYSNDQNLLEYRMKMLESSVDELRKEIQEPIFKKLGKYKTVLGWIFSALLFLMGVIIKMYDMYLMEKIDRLNDRLIENTKLINNCQSELSDFGKRIYLLEYKSNGVDLY